MDFLPKPIYTNLQTVIFEIKCTALSTYTYIQRNAVNLGDYNTVGAFGVSGVIGVF